MVMQQTEMSDAVGVSKTINCKAYADLHPEQKKYIFCHLHLGVAAPILKAGDDLQFFPPGKIAGV